MIKKLGTLLVLVAVAYSGFRWGPMIFPLIEGALGIQPQVIEAPSGGPSPELAEATLDRF